MLLAFSRFVFFRQTDGFVFVQSDFWAKMLFNSIQYLCFFPLVAVLYFALHPKHRWGLLLAASYYFYMCWKMEYIFLILFTTLIDYAVALRMAGTESLARKRLFLCISLVTNLGLLFAFKYFNFFSEATRAVFAHANIMYAIPQFKVLLPVGLSFYTFQSLSYTIDVYRGKQAPERHVGLFALYVAYFPQLVAGPISRAQELIPQFYKRADFDYERVTSGLKLIAWGMFKKVVIADRVAKLVDTVYSAPMDYPGYPLILATVFFAVQIYCDFSGYCDIAIGSAEILGFHLPQNFKRPYFATSMTDFWKRWHMSLCSWFRDYLYIALGGNRAGVVRGYVNVFVTFLLSGLWHGANWTFLAWGALHGAAVITEKFLAKVTAGKPFERLFSMGVYPGVRIVRILLTFALVNVGWVLFRAKSFADASYVLTHAFDASQAACYSLGLKKFDFNIALVAIMVLFVVEMIQARVVTMRGFVAKAPVIVRWPIYVGIVFITLVLAVADKREFIYFQF